MTTGVSGFESEGENRSRHEELRDGSWDFLFGPNLVVPLTKSAIEAESGFGVDGIRSLCSPVQERSGRLESPVPFLGSETWAERPEGRGGKTSLEHDLRESDLFFMKKKSS